MKTPLTLLIGIVPLVLGGPADLEIGDYKAPAYGDWKVTGTAFKGGLASGDLLPRLEIENAKDNAVITSEIGGDLPTGTLTSPIFKIQRRYIAFWIGGGDYERDTCIDLLIRGKVVRSATGRRSDRMIPVSWDVSRYRGSNAEIRIADRAAGDWGHINVDRIVQTDRPERLPMKAPLYQEALRPQFHFTARQWTMERLNPVERQEGWINDLNGLIYYDGEYHLFAQRWAKCWLHAVSKDLVHWTELEPAFWEEEPESGVQSGTCVVDYQNTSGLSKDPSNPPLIAFWSRFDNRSQCLCYSLDHGRTWKRYEKNPIMDYPERDPKVFWYAPGKHWVMLLYGQDQYHILNSSDLLHWTDQKNPIHDSFECPDFFELPIDGDASRKKWVLIQGNGNYSIGTFDGKKFTEETPRRACDVGPNFYATQSWANTETGDGRRIQTAWMRGATFPDMPFSQMISFPCQLSLRSTSDGLRIFREPIREIERLHDGHRDWKDHLLNANESLDLGSTVDLFHIEAEVSIPDGASLIFDDRGSSISFGSNSMESGTGQVRVQDRVHRIELLLDRGSIETFVNRGEISSTRFALPSGKGLSVRAENGPVLVRSLTVHRLKSAWPKQIKD